MSHVSVYGDTRGMGAMKVGQFQGITNALLERRESKIVARDNMKNEDAVLSWDVPYETLVRQLPTSNTTESRMDLLQQLEAEQNARVDIEATLERIARRLGSSTDLLLQMKETFPNDVLDDCYETNVELYMHTCTKHRGNDYRLRNMHMFLNLCSDGYGVERISEAIRHVCV